MSNSLNHWPMRIEYFEVAFSRWKFGKFGFLKFYDKNFRINESEKILPVKLSANHSKIFVFSAFHVTHFETDFEPRKSISNENKNGRKTIKAPKFYTPKVISGNKIQKCRRKFPDQRFNVFEPWTGYHSLMFQPLTLIREFLGPSPSAFSE